MSLLQSIFREYKNRGLYGVKRLIQKTYFEQPKPIQNFNLYAPHFKGKSGIEIGGLSPIFAAEIPLYKLVENVDGCNFSNQTVWEGAIQEGNNYNFYKSKKGHQYVCEASDLKDVPSEKYDFLVSSHCLEHCANALKTVAEWTRVVKKGGAILLILPDRNFTFDHNRNATTFEHLLADLNNNVDEHDLTHLPEILQLHDLSLDLAAGTKEQFEKRSLDNFNNRCLHQHVFDFNLLEQIYEYNNIRIIDQSLAKPYHQIILGINNKEELPVNDFTRKTYALHYYDSILVIEKRAMKKPVVEMRGEIIIPIENFAEPETKKTFWTKAKRKIARILKRK